MKAQVVFGIDVGGTTVKCGLFTAEGKLLDTWEIPTRTENQGSRILPDVAESLWFYNPFGPTCRSFFPSEVGYWQTRIGDHCFYNPTDAYYQT